MAMDPERFDDWFYGTVTIGERGQVVIPASARQELGYRPGDKLLVMRNPVHMGVMYFKIDAIRSYLNSLAAGLDRAGQTEDTEVKG
jgi:AbrB family looped-hinge helix DNA binding protein